MWFRSPNIKSLSCPARLQSAKSCLFHFILLDHIFLPHLQSLSLRYSKCCKVPLYRLHWSSWRFEFDVKPFSTDYGAWKFSLHIMWCLYNFVMSAKFACLDVAWECLELISKQQTMILQPKIDPSLRTHWPTIASILLLLQKCLRNKFQTNNLWCLGFERMIDGSNLDPYVLLSLRRPWPSVAVLLSLKIPRPSVASIFSPPAFPMWCSSSLITFEWPYLNNIWKCLKS